MHSAPKSISERIDSLAIFIFRNNDSEAFAKNGAIITSGNGWPKSRHVHAIDRRINNQMEFKSH